MTTSILEPRSGKVDPYQALLVSSNPAQARLIPMKSTISILEPRSGKVDPYEALLVSSNPAQARLIPMKHY